MAKKTKAKKSVRRVARRSAKSKSSTKSMLGGLMKPLSAVAYGFVRDKISDSIANSKIGQQLPATQFTDEAVMLGLLWGVGKTGLAKKGFMKSMVMNAKAIEYGRLGETLNDMNLFGKKANQSVTTSTNVELVIGE